MDWGLAWATTATGMIVVFAVLIILIIIVAVLGRIMYTAAGKNRETAKKEPAPVAEPVKQPSPAPVLYAEEGVSPEVVAAISAAVAVMLSGEGKAFRIRSVRRVRESRPVWSMAGLQENTRPF